VKGWGKGGGGGGQEGHMEVGGGRGPGGRGGGRLRKMGEEREYKREG